MTDTVSMRPVTKEDEDLLFEIYYSTRADEVAGFGWEQGAIDDFIRMQFDARRKAYEFRYAKCENAILIFDGREVGSVIIDRSGHEISLVDIAILSEFRKKGIATYIIRELQEEAASSGKAVTLRVAKQNSGAIALYEKLGFARASESDLMFAMRWLPTPGES